MRENLASVLRLLLVTDDVALRGRDPVTVALAAVAGGVTAVQLRLKTLDDRTLAALARRLLAELPVPLFLNDRLDVALAVGAAGVHLGSDDLPPERARRIVPPGFIIGASVGLASEIERGAAADYWGIGPLHGSGTKTDAGDALGWDAATTLLGASGSRPCVVIGGVRPDDVPVARANGFAGVAVVSGILNGEDVTEAAREYVGD